MEHFSGTAEEIEKKCKEELTQEIVDFIEESMAKAHSNSKLIAVLHKIQNKFGFLSKKKLEAVSYLMNIPTAKVSGVATFYHYFQLKERGKFIISICIGTACHVKGAQKIVEKFEEELGIKLGETTKDGLFTLEGARCLGTCALAPVVKIDDEIYSQVTPAQVPKLLEKYFKIKNKIK